MSTVIEREIRFLVEEPAVYRAVTHLTSLGSFMVVKRRRERQRNTYFDTTDMRLWRARSVLKLRETRVLREVTLKKALAYRNGIASRLEVTSRLRPTQRFLTAPGRLAIAPMQRAKRIIGAQPLQRLLTIITDRTTLVLAKNRRRVELDVDRVAVRKGRRILARRLELEVENLTATPAVFREAIAALRHRYGEALRLSRVSKFEFGWRVCYTGTARHGTPARLH